MVCVLFPQVTVCLQCWKKNWMEISFRVDEIGMAQGIRAWRAAEDPARCPPIAEP